MLKIKKICRHRKHLFKTTHTHVYDLKKSSNEASLAADDDVVGGIHGATKEPLFN